MSEARAQIWSGPFFGALFANLILSLLLYLLVTVMALFAVDRFQASDNLAGFASSAFILGAVVARSLSGRFVDEVGRRRTLAISLVVSLVASLLYLVAGDVWTLIVLRLVHGMTYGAGALAVTAAAMDLIPSSRRGEGTGYFSLSNTAGTAIGPSVAVILTESVGFESLFAVCAAVSAVGLALALALHLPERPRAPGTGAGRGRRPHLYDFFEPAVLKFSAVTFVAGVAWAGFATYLNAYALEADLIPAASTFFLVYGAFLVIARLSMGRIQDRFGDHAAMIPALVLYAAGLAMLALPPTSVSLIGSAALLGLGFGSFMPALQSIAVSVTAPTRLAIALSTFFLMLDLGVGVAPLALGALLPLIGYQGMYAGLAVMVSACIGVYWAVHMRRPARPAGGA